MALRIPWASVCALIALLGSVGLEAASRNPGPARGKPGRIDYDRDIKPILGQYCYSCHGEQKKGDLDLKAYADVEAVSADRERWELVIKNLRSREMPPHNKPQPSEADREVLITWIESEIFKTDCDQPDPGRVTIRRLNRFEYNNTIRDLVGVDFQPAADFPADDSGYGFDNIGDVLSIPPVLLEKYLAAAEKILSRAIFTGDPKAAAKRYPADRLEGSAPGENLTQGARMLAREGDLFTAHEVTVAGEHVFRVRAWGQQAGPEPVKMAFLVGDKEHSRVEVRERENNPKVFEIRLRLEKGNHRLAVAYLNNYVNPESPNPNDRDRNLIVEWLEVESPPGSGTELPPEPHRRIFFVQHQGTNRLQTAREVIGAFARRAYRRPLKDPELDRLMGLYRMGESEGDSFEASVKLALTGVLVSPHFLFRGELQPNPDDPAETHEIDEHALAARLSYFLWSSMPDDELFRLAERRRLRRNLDTQVKRMLLDPKAGALVVSFGGQWLQTRNLDLVSPDVWTFPEFDDALREAMKRETELFFGAIVREDRSVLEFLDADYTFVNERLAAHYSIPGVKGEEFQRVSLTGTRRGGVLTQASFLTITSNPTRTSPVKRGKWILENILGTPPPPPPPEVPELSEEKAVTASAPLKVRLQQHRENPNCATCHARMDPIGFGFENFNAIGRWRPLDGTFAIEPAGQLVTGEEFQGSDELKRILVMAKREEFLRCLADKLLIYALGRGTEYYDRCALDRVVKNVERKRLRFSALVQEIVRSVPFQMRRGERRHANTVAVAAPTAPNSGVVSRR